MEKIYLIKNEEGFYKIGKTRRDVEKRIKDMKTSYPSDFQIIHEYSTEKASQIENYLHRVYKSKHINREWFELTIEDIKEFLKYCEKHEENLKTLESLNNPFI